jgi:hypothetical protein
MRHEEIKHRLQTFYDGELTGTEIVRIAVHLAGCPECYGELNLLQAIDKLLTKERAEADIAFEADIMTGIMHERRFAEQTDNFGWWKVPALALASCAVYLLYAETRILPSSSDYLSYMLAAQGEVSQFSNYLLGTPTGEAQILAMALIKEGGNEY